MSLPDFDVLQVIKEDDRSFHNRTRYTVEIKPDCNHPWTKDWSDDKIFSCTFYISRAALDMSGVKPHHLVHAHVKEAWSDWWDQHWSMDGNVLTHPENRFTLKGAL